MKIQVLSELQSEISRLFIAGAKFSKDDPRLARLVPTLAKLGERAPIMLRLSQDLEKLISAPSEEASTQLLDLGTLLYSVLNTQGGTLLQGDFSPIDPPMMLEDLQTEQKYSRLYPVMEALTTQKSGRLEVIRKAHEEGIFSDMRTHGATVAALEERNVEIIKELEEIIISSIGKLAIPHLLRQYDPLGENGAARMLALLGRLGYLGSEDLALSALKMEKTSIPVSVAAIGILGYNSKNEELLLALSRDKKKDLREAALTALVQIDSERGKRLLLDILKTNGYKSAVEPLADCLDIGVKLEALDVLKSYQQICLTGGLGTKEASLNCEKLVVCAGILRGVDHPDIIEYIQCAMTSVPLRRALSAHSNMLREFYRSLLGTLSGLQSSVSDHLLEVLADDKDIQKADVGILSYWFAAAVRMHTSKEIYRKFINAYHNGLLDSRDFQNAYQELSAIDERWIDEFLYPKTKDQYNDRIFAIRMISSEDTRHVKELVKVLEDDLNKAARSNSSGRFVPPYLKEMLEKLFKAGVPKAYTLLVRALDDFRISDNYYMSYLFKVDDESSLVQYLTLADAERLLQKYGALNGGRHFALLTSIINFKKSEAAQ